MSSQFVKSLMGQKNLQELTIYFEEILESTNLPTWCSESPIVLQTWAEKIVQEGNVLCGNSLAKILCEYLKFDHFIASSVIPLYLQLNNLVDLTAKWETSDLLLYISFWESVNEIHMCLWEFDHLSLQDYVPDINSSFLNTSVDENVSIFLRQIRLKALNLNLEAASHEFRKIFRTANSGCIKKLLMALKEVGDFDFQTSLVESVFRLTSASERRNLVSDWFPNLKYTVQHLFVQIKDFDPDCRKFLNAFNNEMGENRKVFSFPSILAKIGEFILTKPNISTYEHLWVDFNMGSYTLSLLFDRSGENLPPSERVWETIIIYNHEVEMVTLTTFGGGHSLVLKLGREPTNFFASPPSQEACNLMNNEFFIKFPDSIPNLEQLCTILYKDKLQIETKFSKTSVSIDSIKESKKCLYHVSSASRDSDCDQCGDSTREEKLKPKFKLGMSSFSSESIVVFQSDSDPPNDCEDVISTPADSFLPPPTKQSESNEKIVLLQVSDPTSEIAIFEKTPMNSKPTILTIESSSSTRRFLDNQNFSGGSTSTFPTTPESSGGRPRLSDRFKSKSKLKNIIEAKEDSKKKTSSFDPSVDLKANISDSLDVQIGSQMCLEEFIPTVVDKTLEDQNVDVDSDEDIIQSSLMAKETSTTPCSKDMKNLFDCFNSNAPMPKKRLKNVIEETEESEGMKNVIEETEENEGMKNVIEETEESEQIQIGASAPKETLNEENSCDEETQGINREGFPMEVGSVDQRTSLVHALKESKEQANPTNHENTGDNSVITIEEGQFKNAADAFVANFVLDLEDTLTKVEEELNQERETTKSCNELSDDLLVTDENYSHTVYQGDAPIVTAGECCEKNNLIGGTNIHCQPSVINSVEQDPKDGEINETIKILDPKIRNDSESVDVEEMGDERLETCLAIEGGNLKESFHPNEYVEIVLGDENCQNDFLDVSEKLIGESFLGENDLDIPFDGMQEAVTYVNHVGKVGQSDVIALSPSNKDKENDRTITEYTDFEDHEKAKETVVAAAPSRNFSVEIEELKEENPREILVWEEKKSAASAVNNEEQSSEETGGAQKVVSISEDSHPTEERNLTIVKEKTVVASVSSLPLSVTPKKQNSSLSSTFKILADYPVQPNIMKTPQKPSVYTPSSSRGKKRKSNSKSLPDHYKGKITPTPQIRSSQKGSSKKKLLDTQQQTVLLDDVALASENQEVQVTRIDSTHKSKDRASKNIDQLSQSSNGFKFFKTKALHSTSMNEDNIENVSMTKRKKTIYDDPKEMNSTHLSSIPHRNVFSDFDASDSSDPTDWLCKKKKRTHKLPLRTYPGKCRKRRYDKSSSDSDEWPNKTTRPYTLDSSSDADSLKLFKSPKRKTLKSPPLKKYFTRSVTKQLKDKKNKQTDQFKKYSLDSQKEKQILKSKARDLSVKGKRSFQDTVQRISSPELLRDTSLTHASSFEEAPHITSHNVVPMRKVLQNILPRNFKENRSPPVDPTLPPAPPYNTPISEEVEKSSQPNIVFETQEENEIESSHPQTGTKPKSSRFSYIPDHVNESSMGRSDCSWQSQKDRDHSLSFRDGVNLKLDFDRGGTETLESDSDYDALHTNYALIPSRPNSEFSSEEDSSSKLEAVEKDADLVSPTNSDDEIQTSRGNKGIEDISGLGALLPPSIRIHPSPSQESLGGFLPSGFRSDTKNQLETLRMEEEVDLPPPSLPQESNEEPARSSDSRLKDAVNSVAKYISCSLTPRTTFCKDLFKTPLRALPRALFGSSTENKDSVSSAGNDSDDGLVSVPSSTLRLLTQESDAMGELLLKASRRAFVVSDTLRSLFQAKKTDHK